MSAIVRSNSGLLELTKWLAFGGMLVDHTWKVLDLAPATWAVAYGRMVFPAFALVFAYNMARPGMDIWRLCRRLVLFALIAQPLHWLAFLGRVDPQPLNILFTFAVSAAAIGLWSKPWAAVAIVAVGGLFVDYAWPGVLFVIASWYWWRRFESMRATLVMVFAYSALCAWNDNGWAMLTMPLLFALSLRTTLEWPRWGTAFYIAYPLHFALLIGLRVAGV